MTVPRLLAITDPAAPLGADLERWIGALVRAGVDGLQIRLKNRREVPDRVLLTVVERARQAFPHPGVLLVNGRLDVALAAGADGVHLPAAGLPTGEVRRLAREVGRDLLVGRSTHRPEEVARARDEGADYVTFGPVYPTPSKEGLGEPPGLDGLALACRAGVPVLALGGVDAGRLGAVARAGAAGAAGIRAFYDLDALPALVEAAAAAFGRRGERPGAW